MSSFPLSLPSAARSHHVDDPVLAAIRAKLSAARQATQRPTVSYRAGQAPVWALLADEHRAQSQRGELSAMQQPAGGDSGEQRVAVSEQSLAAAAAATAPRSLAALAVHGAAEVQAVSDGRALPLSTRAVLAVPEPEDDCEDEHDLRVRQRRAGKPCQKRVQSDRAESSERQPPSQQPADVQRLATDAEATDRQAAASEASGESGQSESESVGVRDEDEWDDSSLTSSPSSPSRPPRSTLPFKPRFQPRSTRSTVGEREQALEEQWRAEQAEEQQRDRRRQHTRSRLHSDELKTSQRARQRQLASEYGVKQSALTELPDDSTDSEEEETERDAWKLRELHRLRRDREALQRRLDEGSDESDLTAGRIQREVGRLQSGVDDCSTAIDVGVAAESAQSRASLRFLQRYYHVGAFFADSRKEDAAFTRDFNAATGEDRTVDRALLPAVMQVKRFGLKGRTKYTHLADQDTSRSRTNPTAAARCSEREQHSLRRADEVGVRGYQGRGAAS